MNPPKCKVCGFAHWAGGGHYSGQPVSQRPAMMATDPLWSGSATREDAGPVAANPKRPRGRPISPEPKSPRAEYQRKLMRQRRAAAKEAKP